MTFSYRYKSASELISGKAAKSAILAAVDNVIRAFAPAYPPRFLPTASLQRDFGITPNQLPALAAALNSTLGTDITNSQAQNLATLRDVYNLAMREISTLGSNNFGTDTALSMIGVLSIAENTRRGTIIGKVLNVPAGSIPYVTPNDGRVIVTGDDKNGWYLVKGDASVTPGSFNLKVIANGATSLIKEITVVSSRRDRATPATIIHPTGFSGWAGQSAAVLSNGTYPVPHPSGATQGLAMKALAADTFVAARSTNVPANFKLSDAYAVGMWVYWNAGNGSVELRFTSDNFATKTKTFSWSWSGQLHVGWNLLTVRPGDTTTTPNGNQWTVAGGFTDADTVNGVEVRLNTNGAADTEVMFGGIVYWSARPDVGAVQLGFDRLGEASVPQLALPILKAAGIKGYWAGDAFLIDGNTNALTYLKQVYAEGWDAISQGSPVNVNAHPDYTTDTARLSTDFDAAQAIFRKQGLYRGSELFSYPLSANNATTDAILAAKGVPMARSGWAWAIHTNEYNAGPKLIGHGAINLGGKTLAQAKLAVDQAVIYGLTINLFTHGLVAGGTGTTPPADTLVWYANDYQALVDYIVAYRKQGLLDTDSPTEWLAKRF